MNPHPTSHRASPTQRISATTILLAALLVAMPAAMPGQEKIQAIAQPGSSEAQGDLPDLIRKYESDRQQVGRFYDLPHSEIRANRLEKLARDWQTRLEAVDFDRLEREGQIDYLLLRTELTSTQARMARTRQRTAEMERLLPFREGVHRLEQDRWRMSPLNFDAAAATVASIPTQVKTLRKRVEREKAKSDKKTDGEKREASETNEIWRISRTLARRAAGAATDVRGTLKTWAAFYDGSVPEFSWWMKKPVDEALASLEDYSKFLREEIAGLKGKEEDPLVGDPIGSGALAQDLAEEWLPYSAEELIAIGETEFAWCEARMKEAARDMGLNEDWKAALDRVKAAHVPPGRQDQVVLEEARSAIEFVKGRNLVTVPPLCEELWRLTMLSTDAQKTLPYAAYSGPNMLVAYAREDMKHEDKLMSMRGNNRHFTRIVTAHELIPGHHLQAFMSARHRQHRNLFGTPFYVEGWALYWEMLLWNMDYARNPEDRVGMLFWRMHRSARILVSLKFHLGRTTPSEMVDFLVNRVGHERSGATSEVRRFIGGDYSPLYQCAYMIGGLQLKALHDELVTGGKMNLRQFNDAVLTLGPIPIELIRASLVSEPLSRTQNPGWKFAR